MKTSEIKVTYMDHMGSDLTVVNAARASFDKEKEIFELSDIGLLKFLATGFRTKEWETFLSQVRDTAANCNDDMLTQLLHEYKRKAQHWAPFAHPHVEIRCEIPLFLARQLVKHQVGGVWSEVSRRYVSGEPSYWFPKTWHDRPSDIKQGSGLELPSNAEIEELAKDTVIYSNDTYLHLIAKGVAPEEARMVLAQNMMTTVVWTGSLLFWARLMWQRGDSHAQLPAQEFAQKLNTVIEPLFPQSWKALTQ